MDGHVAVEVGAVIVVPRRADHVDVVPARAEAVGLQVRLAADAATTALRKAFLGDETDPHRRSKAPRRALSRGLDLVRRRPSRNSPSCSSHQKAGQAKTIPYFPASRNRPS